MIQMIEIWYSPKPDDNWVIQNKDENGNQVGDTIHGRCRSEASAIARSQQIAIGISQNLTPILHFGTRAS